MTDEEKITLQKFAEIIKVLPEYERARLMGFGEGLAYMLGQTNSETDPPKKSA